MEDNTLNSCFMLALGLYTPVDLSAIFKSEDLKDTGVELDSHITVLYAQGKVLPRKQLMEDLVTILGDEDYGNFLNLLKSDKKYNLLDSFYLSSFENDSDYIILKLKKNGELSELFKYLSIINKGLRNKYNIQSDFTDYTPHMTLAELIPGKADDYLNSENLNLLLKDSTIEVEDLLFSVGMSNETEDRKQYFLTQFKNIDRYFRLKNLKEISSEL